MTPVKVLIVDDDDLVRDGLSAVLSSDESIEIVDQVGDGRQGIDRARFLRPDVVLMDVRMPELDGINATRELLTVAPEAKVVILTTFEEDDYIFGALKAGASGFLLKRTPRADLIAAIHAVAAGEGLLSPSVTRRVIDRMANQPLIGDGADPRLRELTPREREVLTLIGQGFSNPEITTKLHIEETTVKTHVRRILMKLHLRDRVHAVIFAYESGLVQAGAAREGATGAS
jgi:DNA-binding NarL/FixJ family response regulator